MHIEIFFFSLVITVQREGFSNVVTYENIVTHFSIQRV